MLNPLKSAETQLVVSTKGEADIPGIGNCDRGVLVTFSDGRTNDFRCRHLSIHMSVTVIGCMDESGLDGRSRRDIVYGTIR